jgi:hypothetical protein
MVDAKRRPTANQHYLCGKAGEPEKRIECVLKHSWKMVFIDGKHTTCF